MACDQLVSCCLELPGAIPHLPTPTPAPVLLVAQKLGRARESNFGERVASPPAFYFLFFATQIEDGGKAALSQKMRTGDELVNINGTPLYGSRQEALILIKGSFRILKLIVRR